MGSDADNPKSLAQLLSGLRNGNDAQIRKELQNKYIFIRKMDGPDGVPEFAMEVDTSPGLSRDQ